MISLVEPTPPPAYKVKIAGEEMVFEVGVWTVIPPSAMWPVGTIELQMLELIEMCNRDGHRVTATIGEDGNMWVQVGP